MSRAAPLNAIVRLYLDNPEQPIEPEHVIQTATTGRTYRVVSVSPRRRPVDDEGRQRWYLTARVVPPGTVLKDDVVHTLHWYTRPSRRPTRRERLRMLRERQESGS